MARGERNAGWSGFFLTFTVFAAILLLLAREGQGEAVSAGARQVLVIYEGLTCWAVPALFMSWGMAALEEGKPSLTGALAGLAVTSILQSSSATTVMVIGFVSAGLLELPRAVAVIYGINIGTTMTAQLIAFDVQTLVYPVLFLGFLLDFAARRPRWQAVGEAVFSFGLLFEGIDILGRALQPLAGQAVFLDWMTRVKESPLLGILLGLSMTMVVQSSSATIALLQNVARQAGPDGIHSVLGLAGAVPVLLGDNIGTTVTALLACIGQGKDAARAALAHSCFNLSGSLLAAVLLPWFVRLVELISPKGPELEVISRQIANAHTAFNVCCALLWLPFLPWMVRLVCALVPEDR